MTHFRPLDHDWLNRNPLPPLASDTNKNERGRVLVVGGATFVPGALRLTGEAALRAGAGKLQLATVGELALTLGVLVPEAAMIALPSDEFGEIAFEAYDNLRDLVARCDTLILGPGMQETGDRARLVKGLLGQPRPELSIVLDAGAVTCAGTLQEPISAHQGRVVMTPHLGELAALHACSVEEIQDDLEAIAAQTAAHFNAIIVVKGPQTLVALPKGGGLFLIGHCPGLATSGSGDVLAGLIGGLLARGAGPAVAAAWGVWAHNVAGRTLTERIGNGFLARELTDEIPAALNTPDGAPV